MATVVTPTTQRIKVGKQIVNVDAIAGVHWEGDKLFVHFLGGRFTSFRDDLADIVWRCMCAGAIGGDVTGLPDDNLPPIE